MRGERAGYNHGLQYYPNWGTRLDICKQQSTTNHYNARKFVRYFPSLIVVVEDKADGGGVDVMQSSSSLNCQITNNNQRNSDSYTEDVDCVTISNIFNGNNCKGQMNNAKGR